MNIPTSKNNKIFLIMPRGTAHGWGVCGRYLASELAELVNLHFITEPFEFKNIGNVNQFEVLSKCFLPVEQLNGSKDANGNICANVPIIQAITGVDFLPYLTHIQGSITVGYTFFENNILSEKNLKQAENYYDLIATGSHWCEDVLKSYNFPKTKTVIQGIDPVLFHQMEQKEMHQDYFVIFSGGKLEFRKGQDLVIRAVKVIQEKYKDVLLVTSWFNNWPHSLNSMGYSPYIRFEMPPGAYQDAVKHLLSINGIDVERVIIYPPLRNNVMPEVYRNTDIGLFPNRCEGGTNLVMMEYMACGRPVIASNLTGQKDVLNQEYAFLIPKKRDINIHQNNQLIAKWEDPDLDEIIEKLDWAYHNRYIIKDMGTKGSEAMLRFTWKESAQAFYNIIKEAL